MALDEAQEAEATAQPDTASSELSSLENSPVVERTTPYRRSSPAALASADPFDSDEPPQPAESPNPVADDSSGREASPVNVEIQPPTNIEVVVASPRRIPPQSPPSKEPVEKRQNKAKVIKRPAASQRGYQYATDAELAILKEKQAANMVGFGDGSAFSFASTERSARRRAATKRRIADSSTEDEEESEAENAKARARKKPSVESQRDQKQESTESAASDSAVSQPKLPTIRIPPSGTLHTVQTRPPKADHAIGSSASTSTTEIEQESKARHPSQSIRATTTGTNAEASQAPKPVAQSKLTKKRGSEAIDAQTSASKKQNIGQNSAASESMPSGNAAAGTAYGSQQTEMAAKRTTAAPANDSTNRADKGKKKEIAQIKASAPPSKGTFVPSLAPIRREAPKPPIQNPPNTGLDPTTSALVYGLFGLPEPVAVQPRPTATKKVGAPDKALPAATTTAPSDMKSKPAEDVPRIGKLLHEENKRTLGQNAISSTTTDSAEAAAQFIAETPREDSEITRRPDPNEKSQPVSKPPLNKKATAFLSISSGVKKLSGMKIQKNIPSDNPVSTGPVASTSKSADESEASQTEFQKQSQPSITTATDFEDYSTRDTRGLSIEEFKRVEKARLIALEEREKDEEIRFDLLRQGEITHEAYQDYKNYCAELNHVVSQTRRPAKRRADTANITDYVSDESAYEAPDAPYTIRPGTWGALWHNFDKYRWFDESDLEEEAGDDARNDSQEMVLDDPSDLPYDGVSNMPSHEPSSIQSGAQNTNHDRPAYPDTDMPTRPHTDFESSHQNAPWGDVSKERPQDFVTQPLPPRPPQNQPYQHNHNNHRFRQPEQTANGTWPTSRPHTDARAAAWEQESGWTEAHAPYSAPVGNAPFSTGTQPYLAGMHIPGRQEGISPWGRP